MKNKKLQKTGIVLWLVLLIAALCRSLFFSAGQVETLGTSYAGSNLPIYSVDTEEKCVALTFDSAWNVDDLDAILNILEKNGVFAAFFMTGDWIERYPDEVKKIYEAGHDLGNHGENHMNMSSLTREECMEEIRSVHYRIYELLGIEINLFRPPSGDYDDVVISAASDLNYYSIQWDVDSLVMKVKIISLKLKKIVILL